tara:strand:+ start:303 stop:431 length:129 start_codon:yes stop_codon:yes gene_type:complete
MKTEIDQVKEILRSYYEAKQKLKEVHKKYGTVDINIIKEQIN